MKNQIANVNTYTTRTREQRHTHLKYGIVTWNIIDRTQCKNDVVICITQVVREQLSLICHVMDTHATRGSCNVDKHISIHGMDKIRRFGRIQEPVDLSGYGVQGHGLVDRYGKKIFLGIQGLKGIVGDECI